MATKIIHKKSSTPSSVPAAGDLEPGELALNLADQKIYSKTTGGTVVEMGGGTPSAADLLTSIKTVDGAGSGLDADTLDGVQGGSYLRSDANDSFTGDYLSFPTLGLGIANNNSSNGMATYFRGSTSHFVLGLTSGNTLYLNYGNSAGAIRTEGNWFHNSVSIGTPWGSNTDGSGSGLDADLLDGQQGSYYAPKTIGVYYVTGTGTVAGTWTGSNSDIDSYYEGLVVKFKINIAGASTTTLDINGLGAKTVYLYGTSRLTTHYPVGTVLDLTYTNDNGGSFYATMWYDTTDDYRIRWQNNVTAGAYIHGYQLLLEGMDGKFYPVTEGGANSTTNTVSTAAFKPQGAMLYYETSTDIAANAQGGAYYLYESFYTGSMEYWSNRSTTAWATAGLPHYLVGTINSSGAFILDNSSTTSFLTQDLPTSADGKVYMQIGIMSNTSDTMRLNVNHPIFEYKDGAVRPYAYDGGNQTITLSGDLTGSGTTSINAQLAANVVGAAELNVTGNGTTAQYLRSDGDGSFTWATPTDTNTTYSAGSGIGLSGTTFSVAAGGGLTQDTSGLSHSDTSTQASVNNSNGTVIQDVTLDTYGHVTGLASIDLDGRYYTETEADNRFVNVTGDTMTGNLAIGRVHRPSAHWSASGSTTGCVLIELPDVGTDYDMVNIHIDVYEYNSTAGSQIVIAGHNWTTGWFNTSVQVIGGYNKPIYLARNSSKYYIQLGDTSSTWNYGSVHITKVTEAGFYSVQDWSAGWSVTKATSEPTYSQKSSDYNTSTSTTLRTSGIFVGQGAGYVNNNQRIFADNYHPNADKWTTARTNTVTLTGNVTGSGSATVDGSGNWTVSLSTTNTDKGSSQNIFKNIQVTDTDSGYTWAETGTIIADNNNDTVKFVSGDGIDIDADAANDALRISSTVPFYSVVNTGTVAGTWTGSHNGISSYTDGLIIAFYPNNVAGASTTTLNINNLGAKTIYYYGTSKLTTHYHQKSLILLRYCSDDDCFRVHSNYDSTEDYNVRWENDITVNNSASTGVAVHGYQLLMEGADGKFYPVTEGGAASTTNAVSTAEFRVGGTILFYNAGTDYNANATLTSDSLYTSEYATSMEYWINRTAAWATAYRPVYLVVTLNSNGNFVLDNTSYTSFLTQNLPTSDDGKFYIKIGWMQNTYDAIRIQTEHPVYVYKGGRVREYGGYAGISDKWTTARTLSLTGAVTGSASIDGSGNVSLATTATADPTLTINGDASGSATFTNLGNATLTLTVADDSHNHVISNVDGLQTALDSKLDLSGGTMTGGLTFGNGVTLTEATDRADLLLIKSSTAGWAGLQIQNTSNEGLWSFMTDGSTGGIYDDMSNAWHIQFIDGGATTLYHAGSAKVATSTTGATITGTAVADTFNATSTTNGGFQGIDADTATTPSFTWTADLNTGIYRPAADTLSVTTAGAQRFTVGPAGQIGVGGANYGTSGQVLTSNGTGSAPSWQDNLEFAEGKTWQSVTRTSGTSYQNTTGRTIFLGINGVNSGGSYIDLSSNNSTWVSAFTGSGAANTWGYAVIPPNYYYRTGPYDAAFEFR